jgi:DNA repair exonuclease SbcCD ATPase subunit
MVGGLVELKEAFSKRKAKRDVLLAQADALAKKHTVLSTRYDNALKARIVLQDVAKKTQENLELRISKLVTMALAAVFPDPPAFVTSVETRRNQTEIDLLFEVDSARDKPEDSDAGGAMDIASFALRIACWSLNKTRNTFILDEPFRNLSADLQHKAGEMIKELSTELGIQIIMVSHQEEINVKADRTFIVYKKDKLSTVGVLQ